MTTQKVLITAALPYANGPLHFGHIAGAYLTADCYARFQRLIGNDVVYICGSDEYGIAITLSADLAGRTPKEHVDIFHQINKDFFKQLNMSFDHYSRTSWEGHVEPTHQFFNDLLTNGFIEERVTDQLFSEADQKFLADRYVVGICPRCEFESARGDECPRCGASFEATELKNPRSKLTNQPLTHRATKHWFLLLDQFKERLMAWIETKSWKPNVVNFIKGYINDLHPRAITRDMQWGISVPLPDAEGKVLYVWFDAPIGYISATKEWSLQLGEPDKWKNYWLDSETKLVNFIGKDNIPFHASIFPAMVMGQNQPYKLVDELPANEFYNLEGRQFSKSDNWFIDLEDFFKKFSTDQIRYTIAANAPETADSEFTWKDFQLRCNSELLGKYGNLVNRVLVFIRNQTLGKTVAPHQLEPIDQEFLDQIHQLAKLAKDNYAQFKVRKSSQVIMELASLGNVYFDSKKPWSDAKHAETRPRMETTLACCLECLKVLALISSPIIPQTANQVWHLIGYSQDLDKQKWDSVLKTPVFPEITLPAPLILFKKVEDEEIETELNRLKAVLQKQTENKPAEIKPLTVEPLKSTISIDDVRKLDLRIGIIRSAEPVPKSKKLLKLLVDIGLEERVIISGIGGSYQPQELIGAQVVVVANLQPATLMGIESQGMLLAAKDESQLEILQVKLARPGANVS